MFTTPASNEAANQEWLANLKATRPDAYAAYARYLQLKTASANDPDEGGSATRMGRLRARQAMGYSEQALEEARRNVETNFPDVMAYAQGHGQSTGGLGQGGDELVAAVALPTIAAYMAPAAGAEVGATTGAGTGAAGTGAGTAAGVEGSMVGAGGAMSAEEAALWGVGSNAGAGASTTSSTGLLGNLLGTGGSNMPAWLGLLGNVWAANQQGGSPGAGADPFASERPMYQQMLRELMTDPNKFLESPFFQAQLETGMNAVNRGAAGSGLLGSGNRLLELQRTGSNLAQGSLLNYMQQLGGFAGANAGSPAAAAGLNAEASMNQTNAYLQALRSASPLLTQFAGWALE